MSNDSSKGDLPTQQNRVVREAFTASLPVLLGYLTMGFAYGVLLLQKVPEATPLWATGTALTQVSGSMAFASLDMLANSASYTLFTTAVLALLVNIRYAVYGLPLFTVYRGYPRTLRWLLIWGLTDETYSIICASKRTGDQQRLYASWVTFLDVAYWVAGCTLGALAGRHLPFPSDGIDFAMVALFVVILVDLCRDKANLIPAAVGTIVTAIVLGLSLWLCPAFGSKMLLVVMAGIIAVLLCLRKRLEGGARQ